YARPGSQSGVRAYSYPWTGIDTVIAYNEKATGGKKVGCCATGCSRWGRQQARRTPSRTRGGR
ncbi:hypothetical protein, partial [Streptomyces sp. NPDC041003]|uniref:hypothetical protein n=1 Tax=Streptomyces sp. NPDC041003 TaxID=3155730 RepID=UPI003407C3B1